MSLFDRISIIGGVLVKQPVAKNISATADRPPRIRTSIAWTNDQAMTPNGAFPGCMTTIQHPDTKARDGPCGRGGGSDYGRAVISRCRVPVRVTTV